MIINALRSQRLNRPDDSSIKVSRFRGIAPKRVGEVAFTAEIVILLLERLPEFNQTFPPETENIMQNDYRHEFVCRALCVKSFSKLCGYLAF